MLGPWVYKKLNHDYVYVLAAIYECGLVWIDLPGGSRKIISYDLSLAAEKRDLVLKFRGELGLCLNQLMHNSRVRTHYENMAVFLDDFLNRTAMYSYN